MFLCGPFLCPSLISPRRRAQPRSSMAVGHRERRSVLDGGEHGARLGQVGFADQARFFKRQLSLPVSTISQ